MPVAYRICKAAHAATIWSAIGARDLGGRWNSKGVAVIYTAENRSLAALEQLVHMIKPRVLRGYVIAGITFGERQIRHVDPVVLPKNWRDAVAPPELKRLGDEWVAAGQSPVLAVPSAVVVGEINYLVNPAHPLFGGFAKSRAESFAFDVRLD